MSSENDPAARYPGTPRWVRLTAVAVLLLVLLFAGLHLAGIGMGPGMHSVPGTGTGGH